MTRIEDKVISDAKPWNFWVWNGWCWVLAFSPALVVLALIVQLRLPVPYYDSWAFVQQYQDWCEGSYGWAELLTPHNAHPSAVGKMAYFAVLHFARGNVALLPLVSWLLSLVISLGVLALSRPLWRGRPGLGAGLMFLANLSIFTLIQGHAWIWDFIFQNFIPGACLVTGLLALKGPRVAVWRWAIALLLSLVSSFSFGTGFAVGFLLLPAAGMALEGRSRSLRVIVILLWAVIFSTAGWLALNAFGHTSDGSAAATLFSRPFASMHYFVMMLGHTLGRGTAVGPVTLCAIWGLALLAVFMACIWVLLCRRDQVLIRQSWPWMAFCLWAMFNAAVICVGRFRATIETGLAHRYATFMIFMPLGVLMLAVVVMQLQEAGRLGRWVRKLAPAALVLLLVAHALSWTAGWHGMELFHRRMASRKASLEFVNVLPVKPSVFWHLYYIEETAPGARFLLEHDRLRDVVLASEATVSSFRRGPDISSKWANMRLAVAGEGHDELQGVCGLTKKASDTPDLILITAASTSKAEFVIALVPPELPEDFFENAARRREHYDHYFGWRWPVDRELLPVGGEVTLRAYAYDGEKRKIRLIPGEARIQTPK